MKIDELKIWENRLTDGLNMEAVYLDDLPQRRDAKTDPPTHNNMVLCGWNHDLYLALGRARGPTFFAKEGWCFDPQPDWWCELLIPPPIKKDDGWELAHHGLTGE